ncbi:MAG TPA: ECF-type sigma factor [Acidobacteriaceae bacterium]|nr:ECF-type sigma factor [Acidobacteriaceae bacterium]
MPLQNISSQPRFEPGAPTEYGRQALDEQFSMAYEELRRLASSVKRGDAANTLSPTALVNEAWLRLANAPAVRAQSPLHFRRIAARAMRQVLIEAARRRDAQKRGGEMVFVTFDDGFTEPLVSPQELLALDTALSELASLDVRQAEIVEARFFGGLEMREIAAELAVSEATVMRDWRAARAWLGQRLGR